MNACDPEVIVLLQFGDHNVVHVRAQFIHVPNYGHQPVAPLRPQPGDRRVPPPHIPLACFSILLNMGCELGPCGDPDQQHRGLRPQPASELVDGLRSASAGQIERRGRRQSENQIRRLWIVTWTQACGARIISSRMSNIEHLRFVEFFRCAPLRLKASTWLN